MTLYTITADTSVAYKLFFNITLLYSEIGAMCGIILFYLLVKLASTVILIPNKKYIYAMIGSLYVMILTDNIWKWVANGFIKTTIPMAYFINSSYFIALDIFIYFVIFYFRDGKTRYTYEDSKINISRIRFELKMILGIIFISHIIANFANTITKWFFYIGDDLSYNYGRFYAFEYIIPYGILLVYAIELAIESIIHHAFNTVSDSIYDKPAHIILYQAIPSVMGLIGFKIHYLPLFTVGMTLFLVAFYVRMVEYFVRIDPVTKMHTRRSILKIFNARVKDHNINFNPLTVCMFSITNYYDLNELDGVPIFNKILMKITDTFNTVNEKYKKYSPEVSRLDSLRFLIVISTDERSVLDNYKKDLFENFIEFKKEIGEIEIKLTYAYIRYNDSMKASDVLNHLDDKVKEYKLANRNTYII